MGNLFSSEEDAQSPSAQLAAAQAALQAAANSPYSAEETRLWTRTGKACVFSDSGQYDMRLTQLKLINWAVRILAQETWKNADLIDFAALHQKVLNYKDVEGMDPDGLDKERYSWKLLSEDTSFPNSYNSPVNIFKEFEYVFASAIGSDEKGLKKRFEQFMTGFIRMRDTLIKLLAESCQ